MSMYVDTIYKKKIIYDNPLQTCFESKCSPKDLPFAIDVYSLVCVFASFAF